MSNIVPIDHHPFGTFRMAVAGWLAGYTGTTRQGYAREVRLWDEWCRQHQLDSMNVRRPHIELYARHLDENLGLKKSTVGHKISALASFYRWCHVEEVLGHDPAANVRRPKIDYISKRPSLDRTEAAAFLGEAQFSGGRDNALCSLLLLNGLRISEALGADIEDMGIDRGHRTLNIIGKGDKPATIPLAPRTAVALDIYIGERTTGPIFLGELGGRMDRWAADRIVKRIAKRARIDKRISPHSLRHSFVTNALDAGVPLRDVQLAARHVNPATTAHYDAGRRSLDSHPTYVLTAFVGGGSR